MERTEVRGRGYRRGMILGWTLADIFLLIVFMLLLLFGQMARKKMDAKNARSELLTVSQQLRNEKQANAALLIETGVIKSGAKYVGRARKPEICVGR